MLAVGLRLLCRDAFGHALIRRDYSEHKDQGTAINYVQNMNVKFGHWSREVIYGEFHNPLNEATWKVNSQGFKSGECRRYINDPSPEGFKKRWQS